LLELAGGPAPRQISIPEPAIGGTPSELVNPSFEVNELDIGQRHRLACIRKHFKSAQQSRTYEQDEASNQVSLVIMDERIERGRVPPGARS
jgi:hypothetical protein